jgi:hypothetical protein
MRPWIGDPPRADAPDVEGYALVSHERFNITTGSIAGFVLIPLWVFVIIGAVSLLGGRSDFTATFSISTFVGGAFVALILVPLLHEGVHGIVAMLFRARPSYGIGPGFAYTTFREPLRRVPYLAVGLAPLIVLTVASVVLATRIDAFAGWIVFFAVVNASGAVGDLWMSWRIMRHPRDAMFFDLADGFAVLIPSHEGIRIDDVAVRL